MKKVIIAQLSIKATKTDDFLKLTDIMIEKSLAEEGCTVYKMFKGVNSENEFIIYENYTNDQSVELHNSSNHFKHFINLVTPLLTKEPVIELF
jgi:quinol monooxygenase YgiN